MTFTRSFHEKKKLTLNANLAFSFTWKWNISSIVRKSRLPDTKPRSQEVPETLNLKVIRLDNYGLRTSQKPRQKKVVENGLIRTLLFGHIMVDLYFGNFWGSNQHISLSVLRVPIELGISPQLGQFLNFENFSVNI